MNRLRWTWIVVAVLIITLSGGLVLQTGRAQVPFQPQNQAGELVRYVSVVGVGQAFGVPDQAVAIVGVQTEADTASQALNQNSQQMQSLLNTLRQQGIPTEDIQTQTIQLHPRYDQRPLQPGESPQVTGYVAINTVRVVVREVADLGDILDAAVQADGNLIQGISLEVSDRADLLNQARQAAVENARQKAEHLAELAGAQLGEVLSITETTRTPLAFDRFDLPVAEVGVPVEPGAQAIEVDVQVSWRLLDAPGLPGTGPDTPTPTPAIGVTPVVRTPTPARVTPTPTSTPDDTPTPEDTPAVGVTPVTPTPTPDDTPAVGVTPGTPTPTPGNGITPTPTP